MDWFRFALAWFPYVLPCAACASWSLCTRELLLVGAPPVATGRITLLVWPMCARKKRQQRALADQKEMRRNERNADRRSSPSMVVRQRQPSTALVYSRTRLLAYILAYSLTRLLTYLRTRVLAYLRTRLLAYSLTHSLAHSRVLAVGGLAWSESCM